MTWVKICGMTNLEDALTAVDAGADAVGFVFYEKSPRNISVEAAREIVEKLPEGVEKMGVFVNEAPEKVSTVADQAGLTAVQFQATNTKARGQHVVNRTAFFCLPAIEFIPRCREGRRFRDVYAEFPNLAGILLDSGTREERGGTGKTFAWGEAHSFVSMGPGTTSSRHRRWADAGQCRMRLSSILKPWGVDVASGVEARPGKKDPEKVRAFVKAVRERIGRSG